MGSVNAEVVKFATTSQALTRTPVSITPHLQLRANQVVELLKASWNDPKICNDIFSLENFFLDKPLRLRAKESADMLREIGGFASSTAVVATNNLRGTLQIVGKTGKHIAVSFTMTPQNPPKIQELNLSLKA